MFAIDITVSPASEPAGACFACVFQTTVLQVDRRVRVADRLAQERRRSRLPAHEALRARRRAAHR